MLSTPFKPPPGCTQVDTTFAEPGKFQTYPLVAGGTGPAPAGQAVGNTTLGALPVQTNASRTDGAPPFNFSEILPRP